MGVPQVVKGKVAETELLARSRNSLLRLRGSRGLARSTSWPASGGAGKISAIPGLPSPALGFLT
jgi:hypothetical protein